MLLFVVAGLLALASILFEGGRGSSSLDDGERTAREGEEGRAAPRLLGAGDDRGEAPGEASPEVADSPAGAEQPLGVLERIQGRVIDEAGAPIAGATVFLLPRDLPGYRDEHPGGASSTTDREGRWRLKAEEVGGARLGAMADGYQVTYLENVPRPPGVVDLRLKRCREVVVVVEGMGGPPPEGTRVSARSTGEPYALPGPGSPRRFYLAADVDRGSGQASLYPPFAGPVEIRAQRYGYYSEPDHRLLPTYEPRVTLRLLPSCVLSLRVTDAATGEPLVQGFSFSVLRAGKAIQGGSTTLTGGVFRMGDRLRPGSHSVIVSSDGYLDARHEGVLLREPGGEVTVSVALERDISLGRLRLRVPALEDLPTVADPLGGPPRPAPAFFVFRRRTPEVGAWDLAPAVQREDATTYVFEHMPAGEVDILVGNLKSRRVAVLRSVSIPPGGTNIVTAELRPGGFLEPGAVLKRGPQWRVVALRSKREGALPLVAQGNGWMSIYGPQDMLDLTRRLGPYPAGPIELEVVDGKGRTKTLRLKAEAK